MLVIRNQTILRGLVNKIKNIKIQKSLDTIHPPPTHPSIQKQKFRKTSKVINHEYLYIQKQDQRHSSAFITLLKFECSLKNVNKIMYKDIFSNVFKCPIGHLTHPLTSKVFLDFLVFTWLVTYRESSRPDILGMQPMYLWMSPVAGWEQPPITPPAGRLPRSPSLSVALRWSYLSD